MNTQIAGSDGVLTSSIEEDDGVSLGELFSVLFAAWKLIIGGAILAGISAFGLAFLLPPIYTARTVILPPQQQQSSAAAALSSLGALAGLAGGAAGIKSPADQYVALMQSVSVSNRIIDQYKLMDIYESKYRADAQKQLAASVRIGAGKKDGLISIEVDDESPQRSAAIANSYVDQLRWITNQFAVSEAQQRRAFFEQQLLKTKDKLTQAQVALQSSGFSAGALRAELKAAADGYAKLRAEVTSVEVKLQTMRGIFSDNAPDVIQQQAVLAALRRQLAMLESSTQSSGDADYIGRYREFKYQETLFDMFAKQYELARIDESREGSLIQVLDVATAPERKSKPKRGTIALGGAVLVGLILSVVVLIRNFRRNSANVAGGN